VSLLSLSLPFADVLLQCLITDTFNIEVFDVVTKVNTVIVILCQVTSLGWKITHVLGRNICVNMEGAISRIGLYHIYTAQGRNTEVTQIRHG